MSETANFLDPTAALRAGVDDDAADFGDVGVAPRAAMLGGGLQGRARRQGLIGAAEDRLLGLAETGKADLANSFDEVVALAREVAGRAEAWGIGPVGGYARDAADRLGELQATIRDTPVEHLLDGGRDLIRRQPEIAIGVAVVAGFIAARVVKAGSR